MTSVGSVARQLAALEISSKPNTTRSTASTTATATTAHHQKHPSHSQSASNVSKLLNKYAAPHPFPSSTSIAKTASSTSLASKQASSRPPSPPKTSAQSGGIDIGRYDGGFEIDNESRGEKVYGAAAEELALDSSVSRYVVCTPKPVLLIDQRMTQRIFQSSSNARMASDRF